MIRLGLPIRRRRVSLTPMIDVVFLLLVFFILAARFGQPGAVPLSLAGGGAAYDGPPRLISVAPDGLNLNGMAVGEAELAARLGALMDSPGDLIVLRAVDGTDLQRLVDVIGLLRGAGFGQVALVE